MVQQYLVSREGSETAYEIEVEPLPGAAGRFRVVVDGQEQIVSATCGPAGPGGATLWSLLPEGGGAQQQFDVEETAKELRVRSGPGAPLSFQVQDRRAAAAGAGPHGHAHADGPAQLTSPMPGKVVKVLCAAGDKVKAGQGLLIIEAMKMENELRAPRDAEVLEVLVQEGQSVEGGAVLLALK